MELKVSNLSKQYERVHALDGVSFTINEGEFVSVIGSSGAGKSTLFGVLNGSVQPDGGSVLLEGQDFLAVKGKDKRELQKRIGTIFQDFCLVEQSTCLKNVLCAALPEMAFVPAALGMFSKEKVAEARQLLELVGIGDKAEEYVKNLSGGQKQRVAIARALMRHPTVLLADEPVASLDPVTGKQILDLLSAIQKESGVAILMNSHNVEQSKAYSDRIIGLSHGKIVYDGFAKDCDDTALKKIYGQVESVS